MMKRSTVNKIVCVCWRCAFFVLALVVASHGDTQNLAKRRSPAKPEGTSEQSQPDVDEISVRNALAQPSDNNSTASSRVGTRVQADRDAVPSSDVNKLIVEVINKMPTGGDYSASSTSIQKLESAIRAEGNHLTVNTAVAKPSFCSAATYLVFVSALKELNERRHMEFGSGVVEKLLVTGQHDGVGVWGRWNANGPGTACLFKDLEMGRNFMSIEQAEAGDFLKIFWNDHIGAKEFGHSVIYLGHRVNSDGVEVVRYWSSNKNGGYGRAEVPRSKIKQMLFSHLEYPDRINRIGSGLKPNDYLASMLVRDSTPEEMKEMAGIPASGIPNLTPAPIVGKETEDLKVDRKKEQ
jgi:hypothetical protein